MITKEQAMRLGLGTYVWYRPYYHEDYEPVMMRVSGKCKTWKRYPYDFKVPVHMGYRQQGSYITDSTAKNYYLSREAALSEPIRLKEEAERQKNLAYVTDLTFAICEGCEKQLMVPVEPEGFDNPFYNNRHDWLARFMVNGDHHFCLWVYITDKGRFTLSLESAYYTQADTTRYGNRIQFWKGLVNPFKRVPEMVDLIVKAYREGVKDEDLC